MPQVCMKFVSQIWSVIIASNVEFIWFEANDQRSGLKRIHMGLGQVLDSLKIILEKYPAISTPEVFASVHMLVNYVQCKLYSITIPMLNHLEIFMRCLWL